MDSVHYSSERIDWRTPRWLFDALNLVYAFTLDPCCTPSSALCRTFYTPAEDGLRQSWAGHRVFMNPPYGREIKHWIRKAWDETRRGSAELVVCLVPARTDAGWWHDYCAKGRVVFIRGRLQFDDAGINAPFPSALVIFKAP